MRIRLLVVDDHPVVRDGLKGMLSGEPDMEVIGEAADGLEAVAVAAAKTPDIVLMDLRMPVLDGVAATRRLLAEHPAIKVIVLTTYDEDTDIVRAVQAGAAGYLLKDAPREELYQAIRAAAQGRTVLAPKVAARLLGQLRHSATATPSDRELEVLGLVARGLTNRAIAARLHISEATVKTHLVHVFAKLGVDDRTAAVTVALERGLLDLPAH